MGGNALKVNKSIRLSSDDYTNLTNRVVTTLQEYYPNCKVAAIKGYRNKPDHGDLDVLISDDTYNPQVAATLLSSVETVRNGPVTSIGVLVNPSKPPKNNTFQVDLISSSAAEFNYAQSYYDWNDIGNLIGRVAHKMGLSHGHEGLYYYFRDGDYKFREIVLTRDYAKALRFMGYNPDKFFQGFDSLDDIFKYVVDTPYFNSDIYLLHNRNHRAKTRDKKRPTYTAFLKYCENNPDLPKFEFPQDKKEWFDRIVEFFPNFEHEYKQAERDLYNQRIVKLKFNGDLVTELTGYSDKELGMFIAKFKESIGDNYQFFDWVLNTSEEYINHKILEAYHAVR